MFCLADQYPESAARLPRLSAHVPEALSAVIAVTPSSPPQPSVPSSGGTRSTKTPSITSRKRKADEASYLSPAEEPPHKKAQNDAAVHLPDTPATEPDKMDSDDDFNSSMSGDDFDDQDSDMGLEDGA